MRVVPNHNRKRPARSRSNGSSRICGCAANPPYSPATEISLTWAFSETYSEFFCELQWAECRCVAPRCANNAKTICLFFLNFQMTDRQIHVYQIWMAEWFWFNKKNIFGILQTSNKLVVQQSFFKHFPTKFPSQSLLN